MWWWIVGAVGVAIATALVELNDLFSPYHSIPGPWLTKVLPCVMTPPAILGKVSQFAKWLVKSYPDQPVVKIGRSKVGLTTLNAVEELLALPSSMCVKVDAQSTVPMIRDGLPFVSDPERAHDLRLILLQTTLSSDTLRRFKGAAWHQCVQPWLDGLTTGTPVDVATTVDGL